MKKFSLGPATLVTAAFIGPGTVTACTLAGVNFGTSLLWALLFSVLATMILQEMAARLGIVGKTGLGEALRETAPSGMGRSLTIALVISAIFVGNSAYEGGNISGAVLGIESVFPSNPLGQFGWPVLVGPSFQDLLRGLFIPSFPTGSTLTIISLIGTTVVPYNLFLHASLARERFSDSSDLGAARRDIGISISLGGLISIAIASTAAAAFFGKGLQVESAADMAVQLEPLLGRSASIFMGIGLLAAGVSSSVTAPLAAAYAVSGVLGWDTDLKANRFRAVWMIVILSGMMVSLSGVRPISIIWFAQVANGILLPIIAIYLLKVMNQASLLGDHTNSRWQNIGGASVIVVSLLLSGRSLMAAFGML